MMTICKYYEFFYIIELIKETIQHNNNIPIKSKKPIRSVGPRFERCIQNNIISACVMIRLDFTKSIIR